MFSCVGLDFFNPSPFFMCWVCLTQIPQISLNFSFEGVKSHGGWQIGRGACRSTPSAPSTPISKNSHRFQNYL